MRTSLVALFACLSLTFPLLSRADVPPLPLPDSVQAPPPSESVQIVQPEVPAADLMYDNAAVTLGWDWRDQTYQIHLIGQPGFTSVQSPFWLPLEGLEDLDYEPADGWELMARNFGTAEVGVDVPFLILYNKYRGTVRFIAYINSVLRENFSSGRVVMRFANGGTTTKNLNRRAILNPLNHYASEPPVTLANLQVGWNYADFTVEYDPNVGSVLEPVFVFDVDGLNSQSITLGGVATTRVKGVTDLNQSAYQQLQTLVKNLNKAQTTFQSIAEALNAWNQWEATLADPKQKAGYDNVIKLLKAGKDPLSLVAGLVDLGVTFFGGKKANSQPQSSTTITNLALEGTMTAQKNICQVLIRVPGANHNGKTNALPIWNYPLGLMAIVNSPAATYATSGSAYNATFLNTPCGNCVYLTGFAHMDILQLNGPVTYAINTSFPGALTPRTVEAAWSFSAPHRRPDAPPGWWSPVTPPVYTSWVNNLVNQGRLVMIGSADLYHMGYNEYRTQFVPIDQFHLYKPEISRAWLRAEPWYTQQLGITPPVQVRVRFAQPGGTPANDIIIVKSYDLFWPTSFPTGPEPWTLPTVAPIWAEPVAPLQAVTAPAPGAIITSGQPWDVQWTVQPGSIDSVEVWLSSDNGATFPTLLGTQLENSGTMTLPGLTTVGNQFRVRVRTRNGPTNADAVMTGPFTVRPAAMSLNGAGGCYDHVFMSWIAPGNDGNPGTSGTALEYDLRWSTGAITEVNFSGATRIATNPPLPANSMEQYVVSVPRCSARRYYAVKVRGAANIWSAMSNTSNVGPACPHWPVQCWDEIERATPDETAMIPKVIELSLPGPSPARESSMPVHFGVPTSQRGANYEIAVFDLVGRRIATLGRGPAIPGYHALNWNMASQDGDRVRPGMYFVRLRLGEATLTRRIIAIR